MYSPRSRSGLFCAVVAATLVGALAGDSSAGGPPDKVAKPKTTHPDPDPKPLPVAGNTGPVHPDPDPTGFDRAAAKKVARALGQHARAVSKDKERFKSFKEQLLAILGQGPSGPFPEKEVQALLAGNPELARSLDRLANPGGLPTAQAGAGGKVVKWLKKHWKEIVFVLETLGELLDDDKPSDGGDTSGGTGGTGG